MRQNAMHEEMLERYIQFVDVFAADEGLVQTRGAEAPPVTAAG